MYPAGSSKLQTGVAAFILGLLALWASQSIGAPVDLNTLTDVQKNLIEEHVFGGLPNKENIYIRKGYVVSFDPRTKTPRWVAYHTKPQYCQPPERKGKFSSFRNDPDMEEEATDEDYRGLMDRRGYARGHLAPYAVMGGDRDQDGRSAKDNPEDPDDVLTVFQANYMSNIAPQHQNGFNGSAGLWYKLERWVQDQLVKEQGREVWEIAGCVFGPGEHEKVGLKKDIWVPPIFYKIVIMKDPTSEIPTVLAFLFPHQRSAHGQIEDFLVTVNVIEALTGEDFFNTLSDQTEEQLEDRDTWEVWNKQ